MTHRTSLTLDIIISDGSPFDQHKAEAEIIERLKFLLSADYGLVGEFQRNDDDGYDGAEIDRIDLSRNGVIIHTEDKPNHS